jgi:hypothetical protein
MIKKKKEKRSCFGKMDLPINLPCRTCSDKKECYQATFGDSK